jgi:hypothetical protein
MYLVRVQQRLILEAGPSSQDDSDALNEQMVTECVRVFLVSLLGGRSVYKEF